ncbi:pentatricopeptide repeat-containing protein At3g29230-like [Argentina anserina]|uniref:pentatricopeptide repeat-containing protein At3g29230-like n=1 Tax=Argentina anserina TaxID=57926 RepID=UPI0021769107|nr:pentatricopeptide repeat-containing protein At3g29230-like [Potentilla anserina]
MGAHSLELRLSKLLTQCTFKQLKQIHGLIVTTSLNHDIQTLSKFLRRSTEFGTMEYSNLMYSQLGPQFSNHMTIQNAMIRGFDVNGLSEQCLQLFDEMPHRGLKPHNFTYPYVLYSCSKLGWFRKGRQVHCRIVRDGFESNPSVAYALFNLYVKMVDLNDASKVFDEMSVKNVGIWNRMISLYVSVCDVQSARKLFDGMPERDIVSWNSMITGYAEVRDVGNARDLFERMPEKDVVSWTLMIRVYADAGDLGTARKFFEMMPCNNVVSWNSMIASYTQHGHQQEALDLFVQMQSRGEVPDKYTFVSVLSACSQLGALEFGKWIHYLIEDWSEFGAILGTALIDMYAKCGDINRAFTLFIKMGNTDVFCWNVMIRSVAINGRTEDAVKIYSLMQKKGLKPNDFTFTAALFACSHGGLVKEGERIFQSMARDFGVDPKLEHYGCIIDLLSRNGQLEEAVRLIKEMPYKPDIAIWGAFLGGCRERGQLKLAEEVIEKAKELEANESGVYVLLSNMHASVGQWPEAQSAREKMEEMKIWKNTGYSNVYAS